MVLQEFVDSIRIVYCFKTLEPILFMNVAFPDHVIGCWPLVHYVNKLMKMICIFISCIASNAKETYKTV